MAIYEITTEQGTYQVETEEQTKQQSLQRTPQQQKPEKMVGGFMGIGAIPESSYQQGQRNVLGNIFERPGAAVRSALQGKGYAEGAINPTGVSRFQDLAIEKFAPKTSNAYINFMGGWVPSALGLAADIATNPADVLGMIVGKTPMGGGKTLAGVVAKSEPGQAIGRFLTKERAMPELKNLFSKPGIPKSDAFFMEQANKAFDIAGDAKNSINEEIMTFRDATKDTAVDTSTLQSTVDDLFGKSEKDVMALLPDEFKTDLGKVVGKKEINLGTVFDMKDTVRKYIKGRTWSDYKIGNPVSPDQEKLVTAYFKLDKIIDDSLGNASLVEEKSMLDYLNQKATDVYDLARETRKMVSSSSKTIRDPAKLIGAFMGGEEKAGKRAVLKSMSELEPRMQEVIDAMGKFRNSIQGKQLMKRLLKVAAVGGAAKYGTSLLK